MSDSLQPHGPQPTRLLCPWDSPGKDIGVDCHFFLQGIFLTQGSALHLQHLYTVSGYFHINGHFGYPYFMHP